MIDAPIAMLSKAHFEPTVDEFADLLWLALQIYHAGAQADDITDASSESAEVQPVSQPFVPLPLDEPAPSNSSMKPRHEVTELVGNVFPESVPTASRSSGIPFRSPAAPGLPDALNLARAMRPLMRRVASPIEAVIDEDATVELIAEQRIWSLVQRPAWSRWLGVDLVIDEGASMVIWRQTIAELRRLLERQGAFRNIRIWGMVSDEDGHIVGLHAHSKIDRHEERMRSPYELTDPAGRRLILVVSDCVSPAWQSGKAIEILKAWGDRGPVAIIQMLPRRLWSRSALGAGRPGRLRSVTPGAPNVQLAFNPAWRLVDDEMPAGLKVPIVTLEPASLASWARMLAGMGGTGVSGFAFEAKLTTFAEVFQGGVSSVELVNSSDSNVAAELIQRFQIAASPTAWKLACYLAAAPLTLPVMRLVQRTMLPEPLSRQVHLAEVFLGGLLRRTTPQDVEDDPDMVLYDFVSDHVRELLLSTLDSPDAIAVLRSCVSEFIEERVGQVFDFEAILEDPEVIDTLQIDEQVVPFARVAARVLRRLGKRYAQAAERLGIAAEKTTPDSPPSSVGLSVEPDSLAVDGIAMPDVVESKVVPQHSTVSISKELLEQFERGNVLLFIDARLSRDAENRVIVDLLTEQLKARSGIDHAHDYRFTEVAQAYEDEKGRQALVQFLRDRLALGSDEPQPAHHLIATLTQCNVLVTTALDQQLERAFAEAGRPLTVVFGNVDMPFEDESRAKLYKLCGSPERVETLVLTEEDYERFFEDQESISVVLQGYLARKTLLFIGYDLDDPNFKRLYRKVTTPFDSFARRAYVFSESPPLPSITRWSQRHGISLIEDNVAVFLEVLTDQLAARSRPVSASIQAMPEPVTLLFERPYKLLDYYEASDAAIFFGRRQETQALSALIHAHRLVLLYGASGVGKTSLLLAGVVPRLEQAEPPYATIYVRALEAPALAVRRAVHRQLPDATLPEDGPLVDFLLAATKTLGRALVIVLDQFEEFFVRLSPQFRAAFAAELGALSDARDVPVKVVLSLREDWLAALNELEARIPEVFRNRMRVLPLSRDQARQAIAAPVERLGVSYEPALVERLLDDLASSAGAEVLPPQLQLVCSALYDHLAQGERLITMAAYDQLGSARGVLQKYLDDELARLGRDERALARSVLAELVTSQGTKAVKTVAELALALNVDPEKLSLVLEKLVRARLLRVLIREEGESVYELAHEYLIGEIFLSTEVQPRKQIEELINQEVANWRRFGTLLAADKLTLINEQRELLRLSPDAQELLLRSALEIGDEVEYWLGRVDDPARRMAILNDARRRSSVVRRRVVDALGQVSTSDPNLNSAVASTLVSMLADSDKEVRAVAVDVLERIGTGTRTSITTRVTGVLTRLLTGDSYERFRTVVALEQVAKVHPSMASQVATILDGFLTDDNRTVRSRAREALQNIQ